MTSTSEHKIPPKQSELAKIARDYNSILWQLKGIIGGVKVLSYRLPHIGSVTAPPNKLEPYTYVNKLAFRLHDAVNTLEYCEHLLIQLSESHREAYKYTKLLTKQQEKQDD